MCLTELKLFPFEVLEYYLKIIQVEFQENLMKKPFVYFRDSNLQRLGTRMRQFTPSMATSKSRLSNSKSKSNLSLML